MNVLSNKIHKNFTISWQNAVKSGELPVALPFFVPHQSPFRVLHFSVGAESFIAFRAARVSLSMNRQ